MVDLIKDLCFVGLSIVIIYQHSTIKQMAEKIKILEHKLKHFIIEQPDAGQDAKLMASNIR